MNMSLCMLLCFWQRKSRGATEFTWSVFNFQKDQDVRVKLGYEVTYQNKLGNEVFDKVYSLPWVKHKYAYSWFTFLDQFIGSFQLAVSSVLHSGFFFYPQSQFLHCFHLLVFTLCFLNVVGSLCSLSHAFFFFFCFLSIFYFRFPICRSGKTIGHSMLTSRVDGMWDMTCEERNFIYLFGGEKCTCRTHVILYSVGQPTSRDRLLINGTEIFRSSMSEVLLLKFIYLNLFCPNFSLPWQPQFMEVENLAPIWERSYLSPRF